MMRQITLSLILLTSLWLSVATSWSDDAATLEQAEVQRAVTATPEGGTCNLPIGTTATPWTVPVTSNKNILIQGKGLQTTIVLGASARAFVLNCALGSTNTMRLCYMVINSTVTGGPRIRLQGTAVVDSDGLNGGVRVDHIVLNGNLSDHTFAVDGWIEGVVDHVVLYSAGLPAGQGEHFIINTNASPVGTNPPNGTGGFGDYSFSQTYSPAGPHQLFIENCIFYRKGAVDTNDVANASGALYTARHNTSWGAMGGGHGTRESGGVRVLGERSGESYKNLFICPAGDPGVGGSNFADIRSGENVFWGNRFNFWGIAPNQISWAQSPYSLSVHELATQRTGDNFTGASGISHYDDNQKVDGAGHFTINEPGEENHNVQYTVDTLYDINTPIIGQVIAGVDQDSRNGDVFAHGVGGTRSVRVDAAGVSHPGFTLTLPTGTTTTTNFAYGADDHWKDFTFINRTLMDRNGGAGQLSTLPISFTYITGSSAAGTLSINKNNPDTQAGSDAQQVTIGPTDKWEIRRVKTYAWAPGSGKMDTPLDSSILGPGAAKLATQSSPNPRWTNQQAPGIYDWDNKYRVTEATAWASAPSIISAMGGTLYLHTVRNYNHNTVKPAYNYSAFTAADPSNPDTLVGCDDEAWLMAPAALKANVNGGSSITNSEYQDGSGGYSYPHPLTNPGPTITGGSTATVNFSSGTQPNCGTTKANCYKITTSQFTNLPTITISSWVPSSPSNVSFTHNVGPTACDGSNVAAGTAVICGTANSASAIDYTATIFADESVANEHATQVLTLHVSNPNNPPSVNLTVPADGATFNAPAVVTLTATAGDIGGSVADVKFYRDAAPVPLQIGDTVTGSPYTTLWTNVPAGTYSITAVATDNLGATTTSTPAHGITVNNVGATPTPPAFILSQPIGSP